MNGWKLSKQNPRVWLSPVTQLREDLPEGSALAFGPHEKGTSPKRSGLPAKTV
ncbi:hypothetical protein ZHAS_00006828 [Anopheles sinensis]|uniref:Uncharacterized protein n=1 Tax=Anopheles sinensis TaxID=74873 RepID=A0A084VN56_ANOSI|nr:hypothetical protein ZHAS_00006828 [Anopheles sinensis]